MWLTVSSMAKEECVSLKKKPITFFMLIKISLTHWLSRYLLIHVVGISQILGKITSNKIKFLPSWGLYFRRRRWMANIKWLYTYMSTQSSNSSHPPPFPTWCPYICSLCLCLYFCFVNMFIYTIFSRFLHMYVNIWYLFFFLTYSSPYVRL